MYAAKRDHGGVRLFTADGDTATERVAARPAARPRDTWRQRACGLAAPSGDTDRNRP